MSDRIQFLLSIDVEPAERLLARDDPQAQWGLEELIAYLGQMRQTLSDRTGRPACFGWYWRLDPQIEVVYGDAEWPLKRFAGEIAGLLAAGDACGVHPHAWRWDAERGNWFTDHADQDWVAHCVETSFDAFENFFKAPCKAFRFGDGWINQATLDLVEYLGGEFDLTLEAGRPPDVIGMPWESFTGDIPDLRDVPKQPYRTTRGDYRRPADGGDGGLWIVPVSTGVIRHAAEGKVQAIVADANAAETSLRRNRLHRALHKSIYGSRAGALVMRSGRVRGVFNRVSGWCLDLLTNSKRTEFLALNMVFQPFKYAALLDQALAHSDSRYVHTVLRSGDLVDPRLRDNYAKNLSFLLNHPLAHRFEVSTPSRLAASWRQ